METTFLASLSHCSACCELFKRKMSKTMGKINFTTWHWYVPDLLLHAVWGAGSVLLITQWQLEFPLLPPINLQASFQSNSMISSYYFGTNKLMKH